MSNFIDLKGITDYTKMPDQIKERMKTLTPRERRYFMLMWPKSGVLYITSKPGIAKSAISREITSKMGFRYMEVRLSMVDETDVGLFPNLSQTEVAGESVNCLDFVVPRWAIEANKQPTIIHFEELNRAQLPVRNAALQILLERQIGTNFAFNDTVLMMASGNLGDEDGTDVEEFDNALNNRLIHVNHTLGADEWIDNFAKDNCHPVVTAFIKAYPEKLYQNPTANTPAFATPRTWRFLSDWIIKNFGIQGTPREFLPDLKEVCHSFIGNGSQRFLQYCQEMISITIKDILNRFDKVEKELEKYNRDKHSELIQSLKEMDLSKLTDKQLENVTKFLKTVSDDEVTGYLLHVLDTNSDFSPRMTQFLQSFQDLLLNIRRLNNKS